MDAADDIAKMLLSERGQRAQGRHARFAQLIPISDQQCVLFRHEQAGAVWTRRFELSRVFTDQGLQFRRNAPRLLTAIEKT